MMPAHMSWLVPLCMIVSGPAAAAPLSAPAPASLTAEQVREDIQLAIDAVEAGMPDVYWHQAPAEWEQAKAEALARVPSVRDPIGVWSILAPLMSHVGEGHLTVFPSRETIDHERKTVSVLPLDLHWNDQGAFVSAGYGDAADVPVGARLLSINGENADGFLDELVSVTPHDGRIRTSVMRENDGEQYARMRRRLRGDEPRFAVRYDMQGAITERMVRSVPLAERPKAPASEDRLPSLTWLAPGLAYLNVPTFSNAPYTAGKTNFRAVMREIFEELHRERAKRLILDLRENGGGAEPNESILFSFLVAAPLHKYAAVEARGKRLSITSLSGKRFEHEIFDEDELHFQRPLKNGRLTRLNLPPFSLMSHGDRESPVFAGRLVILAGGNTFSGGAELASMLYNVRRGVFVGEEVGGAHEGNTSGYRWRIALPNSALRLGVPLLQFRFNWAGLPKSRGVQPHCPAPPLVSEIGQQRDRAWRMARAIVEQNWKRPEAAVCPTID